MDRRPRLILVLGMHRSGTSAFARALRVFSVALGNNLLPAHPCNPKGFFEDAHIYAFNKALLAHMGRKWYDLPPPHRMQRILAAGEWGADALTLLREKTAQHTLFGLKDPRMSVLLPFWRPVLTHSRLSVHCCICLRTPEGVARSLSQRDNLPPETAYALWSAHTLGALTGSVGLPCLCMTYEALLQQPIPQLERLGSFLKLTAIAAERRSFLEEFLDSALCHHHPTDGGDPTDDGPYAILAKDIYAGLCANNAAPLTPDAPNTIRLTGQWLNRFRHLPPPKELCTNITK